MLLLGGNEIDDTVGDDAVGSVGREGHGCDDALDEGDVVGGGGFGGFNGVGAGEHVLGRG